VRWNREFLLFKKNHKVIVRADKGPVLGCDKRAQIAGGNLARGYCEAPLPHALASKYPNAAKEWGRQYLFPADKVALASADRKVRRYDFYEKTRQAAIRRAGI